MKSEDVLGVERNYAALATKDLVEARDLYHWHLIHKTNVVGTAIGLYRIRKTDPWPNRERSDADEAKLQAAAPKGERTLENSEIREYSWPCILVFVDHWQDPSEFRPGASAGPD